MVQPEVTYDVEIEALSDVQVIMEMTHHEVVACLASFVNQIEQNNLETVILPELRILEFFELFDSSNLQNSWFGQMIQDPERARKILLSLIKAGTYPETVITEARDEALEMYHKKQRLQGYIKQTIRVTKVTTQLFAVLGEFNESGTVDGYFRSVLTTFIFWSIIDRATIDSLERKLASAASVAAVLRWVLIGDDSQTAPDFEKIARLRLGMEKPDQEDVETVQFWFELINALLELGAVPQTILDILRHHPLHSPLRKSLASAQNAIMNTIGHELTSLVYELAEAPQETQAAKPDPALRQDKRQKLVMKVVREHLQ